MLPDLLTAAAVATRAALKLEIIEEDSISRKRKGTVREQINGSIHYLGRFQGLYESFGEQIVTLGNWNML